MKTTYTTTISLLGLILSIVAVLSSPGVALAQNVSNDNWSGPYIGATIGAAGIGGAIESAGNNNDDLKLDDGGTSFGIVGGFNFSPFGRSNTGGWLIGIEADAQTISGDESKSDPVIGTYSIDGSWIASTRLRAGYAWQKFHMYATTGFSFSDIEIKTANNTGDNINTGLAVGLGLEGKVTDNYLVRIEALAYGHGEEGRDINGTKHDIGAGAGILRLGFVRHF
jgi:outer membrane immunogenic protein